jgi:hypothetical protein
MGEKTVIAHSDAETQGNPVQGYSRQKGWPSKEEKSSNRANVEDAESDHGNPVDSVSPYKQFDSAGVNLRSQFGLLSETIPHHTSPLITNIRRGMSKHRQKDGPQTKGTSPALRCSFGSAREFVGYPARCFKAVWAI